jgi:hypothetical protein
MATANFRLRVVFFNFSLQQAVISERFELESSDYTHFRALSGYHQNQSASNARTGPEFSKAEAVLDRGAPSYLTSLVRA